MLYSNNSNENLNAINHPTIIQKIYNNEDYEQKLNYNNILIHIEKNENIIKSQLSLEKFSNYKILLQNIKAILDYNQVYKYE